MASTSIRQLSVDGVPVLVSEVDGPVRAGLRFGVGAVDEPLSKRGITHIVEHLALSSIGSQPYYFNGSVAPLHTTFVVAGSMEQVEAFLDQVCRTVHDLPSDRFADEVRVLTVEGSRRSHDQLQADLVTRYGAVGPAVLGWPEYGLDSTTISDVQGWADRWFTAANAVLWLSAEPRSTLSLPLPSGVRSESRSPDVTLFTGKRWSPRRTDLVSVSVVRTSTSVPGGSTGIQVARERALTALRSKSAVSYSVNAVQLPIGKNRVLCQLAADAHPESYRDVLGELSSTLTDVCTQGPTLEELSFVRERFRLTSQDSQASLGLMEFNATRVLDSEPVLQVEEYVEGIAAVTAEDVVRILAPSLDAVLAIGPESLGGSLPGWLELSKWSDHMVVGDQMDAIAGQERGRLIIGAEGVTWCHQERAFRTVRWQDCVACLSWENGARRVIGSDGGVVVVVPWAWQNGDRLPAFVDEHVPKDMLIHKDAASAPKPNQKAPAGGSTTTAVPAVARRSKRRLIGRILQTRQLRGYTAFMVALGVVASVSNSNPLWLLVAPAGVTLYVVRVVVRNR